MNIAELCVRRPVAAAVMSLIIVLFGLFVLPRLAVRELPAVESPVITVSTLYAGASPQVMDRDITEVVEAAVAGVPGVDTISSQSRRGQATTTIEFSPSLDLSDAANDVRDAVAGIANDLPEDAELPIVAKNDSDSDPIMRLSVVAENLSPRDVTDFVERNLIDRLAVLDGVAQVELEGEKRQAIRVWLDRSQMAARGVTADDVEQALQRNNVELPAGELRTSDRQFTVRADARLNDAADFARVVVKELEGGPVRLEDVARVSLG
ncbi:MAG: efflux RND transporter permease subunit, partial [Pseudomonadota bacterium]